MAADVAFGAAWPMPASRPLVARPAAQTAVTVARKYLDVAALGVAALGVAGLRMTGPPEGVLAEEVVRRRAHVRPERIGIGAIARRVRMRVLHAVDDPCLEHVTAGAVVVRRNRVGVAALEADDTARAWKVVVVHTDVASARLRRLVDVVVLHGRRFAGDAAVH